MIQDKCATSLNYTSRNQIRTHKAVYTTNTCIRTYIYTLEHWLYVWPNACIWKYANTLPHLSYICDLTHTYNITRTYRLPILRYSDIPYEATPYGSNDVYISLYGLLWPCTTYTAFSTCNLSTVTGVTPTLTPFIIYLWRHHICTWLIHVISIIPIHFKFRPPLLLQICLLWCLW